MVINCFKRLTVADGRLHNALSAVPAQLIIGWWWALPAAIATAEKPTDCPNLVLVGPNLALVG